MIERMIRDQDVAIMEQNQLTNEIKTEILSKEEDGEDSDVDL